MNQSALLAPAGRSGDARLPEQYLACRLSIVSAIKSRKAPTLADLDVVFEALSHEVRRHIVQLLAHYGPELPSGYLAKRFSHSWPTTTRHLQILEEAGIVSARREGRNCVYRLERARLTGVVGKWLLMTEPPSTQRNRHSPSPRSKRKGHDDVHISKTVSRQR